MNDILNKFIEIPEVQAIAIGGSNTAKTSDSSSDIDIYIFSSNGVPLQKREEIIKKVSSKYEIGEEYFGSGDEFLYNKTNTVMDMMYWDINWFENIIENVWIKHYPSNGYTTCFLYTLKNFKIIYDPNNWLTNLQTKIKTEYPQELQNNIIKRNMMLMKSKPFASYYEQIENGIKRNDINSVNHRISAFLASYFDVIFAINKQLHPGEKRLIKYAKDNCKLLPKDFEKNITKLLIQPNSETLSILDEMFDNLSFVTTEII